MNIQKSIVCYLKDNNEVATWNALLTPYASLANVITFVPFDGTDKYQISVNVANGVAKNQSLKNTVNFVAIFNSNVEGISNLSLLKDMMFNSNLARQENIFAFTLKTLWAGDILPSLDQITDNNLHFDNNGNEHVNFVNDYLNNYNDFVRGNIVFRNFINLLYENKMLDTILYDEFLPINDELIKINKSEPVVEEIVQEPVAQEDQPEPVVQQIEEEYDESEIEEPVVEEVELPTSEAIEASNEIEFDEEEVDLSNADKVIIVPKKCREIYKHFENQYSGIIRIQKITNLNSVSASFKQCLAKNKNTVFYFFPATSVKNQKVYERKYLALFNYVYKKFNKNPHVQFFKTSGKQPSLYLENILNFDKNTKDVLNKNYTNNKDYNALVAWLKQK